MAGKKSKEGAGEKAEYNRTPREAQAVERILDAIAVSSPEVKIEGGRVVPDHPHEDTGLLLLMDALGTEDLAFVHALLVQLANVGPPDSEVSSANANFMLSIVKGIQPKDQVEAMLAAQMAAVHVSTMNFARRVLRAEDLSVLDISERTLNKLARTFVAQVEALKRYRSGGEQKVTVQHVNVSEGGQAIVGNVTQGRRGDAAPASAAPRSAISDAKTVPMPIIETARPAKVANRRTQKK